MAKQTFTAGQVLTATQMNNLQANDYNWTTSAQTSSYVLTAANAGQTVTMTNAGATTITVNTSLFAAGDTVRILNLGAGATTITAGTATVNSAGSLVLPQYASGTLWFSSASAAIFIPDDKNAALQYITGATFSAQSTVSMPAGTFTSTYQNYLVTLVCSASTALTLNLRYNASGTPLTTNYGGAATITGDGGTETITSAATASLGVARAFDGTNYNQINLAFTVYDATTSTHKASLSGTGRCSASGFGQGFTVFGGSRGLTGEAVDGITFLTSTGNITGNYRVYGYSNS